MTNAIIFQLMNGRRKLLGLPVLLATMLSLSLQSCDSDDIDRGEEPTPANFYVGDNRLLLSIHDASYQYFVFEYGREGLLAYVGTPENSFDVAYAPFNLYDSRRSDVKTDWKSFYFTDEGYVRSCNLRVSSSYSIDSYDLTYSMTYSGGRLSYVNIYGSGYSHEDGQSWRLSQTISLRWSRGLIESINFSKQQHVGGTAVTDQNLTYSFGYNGRSNGSFQYPMCMATIMEGFEFMPLTGLLGFGPDLLPTSVTVVRNRDLVDGVDYGYDTNSYSVSYVMNYDGTIAAEDGYRYSYY